MAPLAVATKSKGRHDMGPHDEAHRRLATQTSNPSSMAEPATLRHLPEVGAHCANRARWDLCGGFSAMSISTAIDLQKEHAGRGRMIGLEDRQEHARDIEAACEAGARLQAACEVVGIT